MRIIFSIIFSIIALQGFAQEFTGKVVDVIDGNTFKIIDYYEEVTQFMLSEVDCPELGQELSEAAKAFSEKMILKKKVIVEVQGKDWLGNKLVIIKLKNGTVLHEELLKEGLGWASKKASGTSVALESSAKDNKIGLWVEANPTPPWIFRRQQTMTTAKSR